MGTVNIYILYILYIIYYILYIIYYILYIIYCIILYMFISPISMYPRPEAHSKVSQDVPRAHEPGEVVELGERDTRETREAQRTHRFEMHDIMTSCILHIFFQILSYLVVSGSFCHIEKNRVDDSRVL